MPIDIQPGDSYPLGATLSDDGVNFCIFSKHATSVELLLFDDADAARPHLVVPLDPRRNRTYYYWHVRVTGIEPGQLYGYRIHGPHRPDEGLRFDGDKVLVDPYARAVATGRHYDRDAARRPGSNVRSAMKSVVVDPGDYDWEGDRPLERRFSRSVIYELHVGGFTRHPNAGVAPDRRGTYAGLIEKIPYLQELGVTAVELLPVQHFDAQDVVAPSLTNYWGYSPVAFFAPHAGYSSDRSPLGPVNEFRDLVKALHRAGIEVILDVVFNHTAEGGHDGPTLSLRGIENLAYYLLESDPRYYSNFSGCGNTLNSNHSVVRRLILDCLRHWVSDMHVDGFRFDLASVMSRGEKGELLDSPPILWSIESDPVLAGTKIIAEAWDAAGLYQVGSFIGHRWAEWNGQFRDDVRRYVKGDAGMVPALAHRITASPDLYPQPDREPNRSINFVTCHDGFTLNDLVSYNDKHNEANGEGNRDGHDANFSWNCGVEGPADEPDVEALRAKQIKNYLAILLLSQGTPMLSMGDEVRRTQGGNNNAYCQDNEISWFDWEGVPRQPGLLRFVRELIRFTLGHELFQEERNWLSGNGSARLRWHGVQPHRPDWSDASRSLAFSLHHPDGDDLYVMTNAYWKPLTFTLPAPPEGTRWHRIVDTDLPSPDDVHAPDEAPPIANGSYRVADRSVVLLRAQ